MTTQVGIFAKHWTPGRVKTRLAATLGDETAAQIAKLFIETLLRRLAATADQRVIGFAPADQPEPFAALGGDAWLTSPQCDGDLGERMRDYFETAFRSGAERVVLLGADSPNLPLTTIQDAFDQLSRRQLVLAPTDDGGYCLIGASRQAPPVFDGLPWSDPTLWRATTERLAARGWRRGREWDALPRWYDVDTGADLDRLRGDLRTATGDASLERLADELDRLVSNHDAPPADDQAQR